MHLRPERPPEPLDWTAEDAAFDDIDIADEAPYDPDPERERMRGWIAIGLLALLSFVVISSLITVAARWAPTEDVVRVLGLLFAPLVGLVGAATGFYYGSRQA